MSLALAAIELTEYGRRRVTKESRASFVCGLRHRATLFAGLVSFSPTFLCSFLGYSITPISLCSSFINIYVIGFHQVLYTSQLGLLRRSEPAPPVALATNPTYRLGLNEQVDKHPHHFSSAHNPRPTCQKRSDRWTSLSVSWNPGWTPSRRVTVLASLSLTRGDRTCPRLRALVTSYQLDRLAIYFRRRDLSPFTSHTMSDELDYLQPDFDLNSLTVPRLRSILVSHDVSYPASAKKAQLVRILEDEVLPQARKLLRDRERVRRTSAGITDMSRENSVTGDEDERDSMHPPPTPSTTGTRRGPSRRSVRGSTVETDGGYAPATPATTKRKSAARSVGKHPRASDTETGDDTMATPVPAVGASPRKSTARKFRRSSVLPSTEVDEYTPSVKSEPREDSVFTDENPFQSGSPSEVMSSRRTPSHDGKRKSGGRLSSESPAIRNSLRSRKSVTPSAIKQEDGYYAPSRESFDFASRLRPTKEEPEEESEEEESEDESESEIIAGEEFTPEEQLALESEQYAPLIQVRKRPKKQSSISIMASWIVILSVLGSFGAWWRKEKIEIGYCGLGKPTWSLAETNVPEWANAIEPRCEPCPPHAFCYPDFEARCEHDFILKPHPLSLGGLVPLPPTCEPDSEKARRVKAVADKAVEELRERRAKYECGELNEDGKPTSPEIPEPKLKEEVAKKRRKGLTESEFDDLWRGALGEIIEKDEVVSNSKQ